MNKKVKFQDLGLKDYKETWEYQEELFQETLAIKIKNRREETALETDNHHVLILLLQRYHPHSLFESSFL